MAAGRRVQMHQLAILPPARTSYGDEPAENDLPACRWPSAPGLSQCYARAKALVVKPSKWQPARLPSPAPTRQRRPALPDVLALWIAASSPLLARCFCLLSSSRS